MKFKALLVVGALVLSTLSVSAEDASPDKITAQEVNLSNQKFLQALTQLNNELQEFQIDLMVKHYDKVLWLENNYADNQQDGEEVLMVFVNELSDNVDMIMSRGLAAFGYDESVFEPEALKQVKEGVIQGFYTALKQGSLLRSMVIKRVKEQQALAQ